MTVSTPLRCGSAFYSESAIIPTESMRRTQVAPVNRVLALDVHESDRRHTSDGVLLAWIGSGNVVQRRSLGACDLQALSKTDGAFFCPKCPCPIGHGKALAGGSRTEHSGDNTRMFGDAQGHSAYTTAIVLPFSRTGTCPSVMPASLNAVLIREIDTS